MQGPEDPGVGSKRTLAAIVFTDIVSFSARVQENEERTLGLAQRDLGEIRRACEANGGRVLKGTGDGLLLYFDSAVEAVGCALSVQKRLAERAETLPPEECLEHRVGIHLGDVFLSEDDVMGDGVNIAARLQSEAPPGGICISQTVYDVVKNRLQLKAIPLGPRDLKNIRESVPIYQLLIEAAGQSAQPAETKPGSSRTRTIWVAAGAVACLAALIATALWLSSRRATGPGKQAAVAARRTGPARADSPREARQPTTSAAQETNGSSTPLPSEQDGPMAAVAEQPAGSRSPTPSDMEPERDGSAARPAAADKQALLADDFLKEEMARARQKYLSAKDPAGMVTWIEANGFGQVPIAAEYRLLTHLDKYARSRIRGTGEEDPVILVSPRGRGSARVWSEGGRIAVEVDGEIHSATYTELPMPIYVGLLSKMAVTSEHRRAARFLRTECRKAGLYNSP